MSDFVEMINTNTRICTVLKNGEPVDHYEVMQCDSCALWTRFDSFGYKKAPEDNPVWFCFDCRQKR